MHRTCSWCNTVNHLPRNGKALCIACGHRFDLPRASCDCPTCLRYQEEALAHYQGDYGQETNIPGANSE